MAKLTELTVEQERLMCEVRDEWFGAIFAPSTALDTPAAIEGVKWLYDLAKLKEPLVVIVDSPLAVQVAASMLRDGSQVRSQVGSQVRSQVWSQVGSQVRSQVGAQVGSQVWSQVGSQVESQVWSQVGSQVRSQVRSQVGYTQLTYETLFYYADFGAFYDVFRRFGVLNHSGFDRYAAYLRSGVSYGVFLDGLAIICGLPDYIKRDAENRLHCEDGPAYRWSDGWCGYYWHGVQVPAKLIESPESVTRDDLLAETNAEVRRAYLERLGPGKFAQLLDLVEIDRDEVGQGTYRKEYALYRTHEVDPIAEEHIQFVNVVCHSTEREYMLCVPPDINDVWGAVAWTFGQDKATYRPIVEA